MPIVNEILLVEDERVIALVEKCILERHGYSVHVERSGEAALAFLEGGIMPELILLDIELGMGIDGIEVARRIREGHDVPVIFIADCVDSVPLARAQNVSPYSFMTREKSDESFVSYIEMVLKLCGRASEPMQGQSLPEYAAVARDYAFGPSSFSR
jgi:CheY-like chemotaxis protein